MGFAPILGRCLFPHLCLRIYVYASVRKSAQLPAGALDMGVRMWDGPAMTSIRASKVVCGVSIAWLVLAVADVAALLGNWPVSRGVSEVGLMVLCAGVFALIYICEPKSFRPPREGKVGFWSAVGAMVVLGAGGGLIASALKPHGVLVVVSAVAAVAMGAALGRFLETHVDPWRESAR